MVGKVPAKTAKTVYILLSIDSKNRLLGLVLFPKSLPALEISTYGRTPTRTGDLIDVNDDATVAEKFTG